MERARSPVAYVGRDVHRATTVRTSTAPEYPAVGGGLDDPG